MEIKDQLKLAQHIFRLLKVTEVVFPIGRTNKGNLGLKFSQNSEGFEIMLDAVPLSVNSIIDDENNIELKKMIEKYWFDSKNDFVPRMIPNALQLMAVEDAEVEIVAEVPKKKHGKANKEAA